MNKLRKITIDDIWCFFVFSISVIPALILHIWKKRIWLFAERQYYADDNAWVLYKWIRKYHPKDHVYFVLDKNALSYDRRDSHMIRWRSVRHFIYFLATEMHVTSHFNSDRMNNRICDHLEQLLKFQKRVYVRHGIQKDGLEMHKYSELPVRLFLCGAKPEYDYFLRCGGYPTENLVYTGLARFDDLLNDSSDERFILIMPTWRRYLIEDENFQNQKLNFKGSLFFKIYYSLINSKELVDFCKNNNYVIKFYLHKMFEKYQDMFVTNNTLAQVIDSNYSVHELLKKTSLLITDYSSVFFDAAYAGKPIIYYHFDYEEFRQRHFSEGYFNYKRDGMGPIAENEQQLIEHIKNIYNGKYFEVSPIYKERCNRFFPLHDSNNCSRIYNEINKIDEY